MAVAVDVPLVLVTGASGFIATHIVQQLLVKGKVKVRGTVRSLKNEEKIKPLQEMVPDATYPLELVEADLMNEESWKEAVRGCSYVYHVASPFPPQIPRDENEIIVPAVEGTLNVLKACAELGTVKRVVLTSSIAAISSGQTDHEYTEADWAPEENAQPYPKSKTRAEKAAWDFVNKLEDDKKFELAVVNPALVAGPLLSIATSGSTSNASILRLLTNDLPALANVSFNIVDVRDVAAGHISAMEKAEAVGNRHLLTGQNLWMREIADIIAREFKPQGYAIPSFVMPKFGIWAAKFFDPTAKMIYPMLDKRIQYSNERMRNILGVEPRDITTTILDTCYNLIELGVVPKKRGYLGPPDTRTDKKQEDTTTNSGAVDSSDKKEEVKETKEDDVTGQVDVTNEAGEDKWKEVVEGTEEKEDDVTGQVEVTNEIGEDKEKEVVEGSEEKEDDVTGQVDVTNEAVEDKEEVEGGEVKETKEDDAVKQTDEGGEDEGKKEEEEIKDNEKDEDDNKPDEEITS